MSDSEYFYGLSALFLPPAPVESLGRSSKMITFLRQSLWSVCGNWSHLSLTANKRKNTNYQQELVFLHACLSLWHLIPFRIKHISKDRHKSPFRSIVKGQGVGESYPGILSSCSMRGCKSLASSHLSEGAPRVKNIFGEGQYFSGSVQKRTQCFWAQRWAEGSWLCNLLRSIQFWADIIIIFFISNVMCN